MDIILYHRLLSLATHVGWGFSRDKAVFPRKMKVPKRYDGLITSQQPVRNVCMYLMQGTLVVFILTPLIRISHVLPRHVITSSTALYSYYNTLTLGRQLTLQRVQH